jgi:hypothetical protein
VKSIVVTEVELKRLIEYHEVELQVTVGRPMEALHHELRLLYLKSPHVTIPTHH